MSGIQLLDGIYEETEFKMVFLVKDSKIHRLIWNHVKGKEGIVSREIYNTDNYEIKSRGDNGVISLKNGLLFRKITTDRETVKSKVKQFYNENMNYLNEKFSEDIKLLQEKIKQEQAQSQQDPGPGESGLDKPVLDRCN